LHVNAQPKIQNSSATKSVFAYVRCSSQQQEVARQLQTLPAAHSKLPDGLADLPLVYFYDEGISAYDGSVRPGLSEMMERIRSGREAEAVLLDTSSRLTRRGIREALALLSEFADAGCRLFASGKEYGFNLLGIINLAIDAEADLRYSENLSHNTRSGKRHRASLGHWIHGQRPVGYDLGPDGCLTPNKHAEAVTRTFALAAEGEPWNAIRRYLSAAVQRDYTRQGMRNLLRSQTYLGHVPCADEIFKDKHPPLTDPITFARVAKRFEEAASGKVRRKPKVWAMAGIAKCEECFVALTFRSHQGRKYQYATCSNEKCDRKGISLNAVRLEGSLIFNIACVVASITEHLKDPTFAIQHTTTEDENAAYERLTYAQETVELCGELIADRAMSQDDKRYAEAIPERDAAESELHRIADSKTDHRSKLARFAHDLSAFVPGYEPGDPGFVVNAYDAWHNVELADRAEFLDRHLHLISAGEESMGLHFKGALPSELYLDCLPPDVTTWRSPVLTSERLAATKAALDAVLNAATPTIPTGGITQCLQAASRS